MSLSRNRVKARHAAIKSARRRALPILGLAALAVGAGVAATALHHHSPHLPVAAVSAHLGTATDMASAERAPRLSRGLSVQRRVVLRPVADGHKYSTAALNLWKSPREHGKVGVVDPGTRLVVTGKTIGGWAEVLTGTHHEAVRYVNADYLADHKPKPATGGAVVSGLSSAACIHGSSVESGLTSSAVAVYRAVCAAFPTPSTYGGLDGHGEHVDGRAIDITVAGDLGWSIAEWLRANSAALHIRDVMFAQHIWTPERSAEGWRTFADRGSATANHYDHVHVAVY